MALPMPKNTARMNTEADEVGDAVVSLDVDLGAGLGGLVPGILPGLDLLLGGGVERGVLEAGGRGRRLGGLGLGQGGIQSRLGLVSGLLEGRPHGLGGFLAAVERVQRVGVPVARGGQEVLDGLGEILVGRPNAALGGRGVVPLDGLERGLGGFFLHDRIVLGQVFVHFFRRPRQVDQKTDDEQQKAHPDGHPVLFLIEVLERRLAAVDDYIIRFCLRFGFSHEFLPLIGVFPSWGFRSTSPQNHPENVISFPIVATSKSQAAHATSWHYWAGILTVNVLPAGELATVMSPPWARATARARLNPRPAPGCDRLGSPR